MAKKEYDVHMKAGKDYIGAACGVVIENERGEILMMKRTANTRNDHGMWSIPGGKIEFGEKAEEAIRREVVEELNLELGELEYLGYVDHIIEKDGHHWVSQIFVAHSNTYSGGYANKEPDKCEAIEWFAWDALPSPVSGIVDAVVELRKKINVPRRTFF